LNIASFIARRISSNEEKTFSRFIIRLATVATAISVAVMIVALAFVNGFQEAVSKKVFSFCGHIRVQHYEPLRANIAEESPIQRNDSAEKAIRQNPEVVQVQAYATKSAILRTAETIEGVIFKGVDSAYNFREIDRFLKAGRWIHFQDSGYSNEIVISEYTSKQLKVGVDTSLLIYFIQPNGEKPRTRKLKIVGIYKTGIEVYDNIFALGDLKLVRRLNDWKPDDIGGYEIFIKDYPKMDQVSEAIYNALPQQWNSMTMREIYPQIFDWLNLQNLNKQVILGIMVVVAIINLITCLIILVLERTRMVGVLKSLGAKNATIQAIFASEGTFICLRGIFWGLVLGLGICFLQSKTGFIKLNEEAYYMATAPVRIIWWQVIVVALATLVTCFLALLIPTFITRSIRPAKAVQFR